ncbi:MAG TPA: DUF4252 domain-containing protein [Chitinophaga sp.]|uniref:DUF4252 domain-containing protein n=1 Tax=Chitinophaga sp. TaxID=1869181 RepID=UPI002C3F41DB|nr:DUF4252 domain-containing protein [Chitinophaga sp.]HVI43325.1 DUF4252 domain-containing protein [Chitinophaga sp.]
MKKLTIAVCMLACFTRAASAQEKSLREFRRSCNGNAETHEVTLGNTAMKFARWCLSFDNNSHDEDVAATRKLLKQVHRLKVYTISNEEGTNVPLEAISKLKDNLQQKDRFEPLMQVREKGHLIDILNKGKDDELGNMVMLIQDDKDFVIVHLKTSLKLSDINGLINHFAIN